MIFFFKFIVPAIISFTVGHSIFKFIQNKYRDDKFIFKRDAWDAGWIDGLLIEFISLGIFFIPYQPQNTGIFEGWLALTCLLIIGFFRKLITIRMLVKAQIEYNQYTDI